MEKAFKQGFSSVVSFPLFVLKNNHFQYDCDLTADEYLEWWVQNLYPNFCIFILIKMPMKTDTWRQKILICNVGTPLNPNSTLWFSNFLMQTFHNLITTYALSAEIRAGLGSIHVGNLQLTEPWLRPYLDANLYPKHHQQRQINPIKAASKDVLIIEKYFPSTFQIKQNETFCHHRFLRFCSNNQQVFWVLRSNCCGLCCVSWKKFLENFTEFILLS